VIGRYATLVGMSQPAEMIRIRPRRIRMVAWFAAVLAVLAAVVLAAALGGQVGPGPELFGPVDRAAVIGFGLLGAAALLSLTRPLVEADADGIRVRNIVGGCQVPWQVVRGIRFERGESWATLVLADDEVIGVLAIQAVDREHAGTAIRRLRALHARAWDDAPR
jgi:hypothetical protein